MLKFALRKMVSANNNGNIGGPVSQRITAVLSEVFAPVTHLDVQDDSHKHAGHAAMRGNENQETHFSVTIVSAAFDKVSVLERHRMVNEVLAKEMDSEQGGTVHALQIKAKTPE